MQRSEALDWLYRIKNNTENHILEMPLWWNEPLADALGIAIEALEQEPRKGHWNVKDNMWWVCSACGCQTRMIKKYNVPRFCPACGAKMIEPQKSEDKE